MKTCNCLLLTLLFPAVVLAQTQPDSVVPDTLDWHRYYPLAQGNVWEYQVSEGEPLLRREIIADTLAAEQWYFLMAESTYDYDHFGDGMELELWTRDTLFVRYDSLGTVVTLRELEADTLAVPRNVSFDGEVYGYFDLRAAFGDTVYYGAGDEDFYWTRGGFNESADISGEVLALKVFQSWVWTERYAADIGFLGGGNLWGPRITYAKIGGEEYGTSRTPVAFVEERALPQRLAVEKIYPNPSSNKATIEYRLPQTESVVVELYNVLGQRVFSERIAVQPVGVHSYGLDTRRWAAGTYFVLITMESGQQSAGSVILIR